jgi:hypothetical protein
MVDSAIPTQFIRHFGKDAPSKDPMPSSRLPALAAKKLAATVHALHLADRFLSISFKALAGTEIEEQGYRFGLDCFAINGYREAVRLFVMVFTPGADPVGRHVLTFSQPEDARNLPGLERVALALRFAEKCLEEALDVIDRVDGGDEWHGPMTGAACMLGMMRVSIECTTIRRRPPTFGVN